MKTPLDIPSGLRIPLAFCVLCCTLTPGLLAWSVAVAADEANRLESLQQARRTTERKLAEYREAAPAIDHALQLLTDIRPLDAGDLANPAAPIQAADSLWRERTFMLEAPILHEEELISRVAAWQARSTIQHHLRACRVHRQDDGLFASCQLAALELQQ